MYSLSTEIKGIFEVASLITVTIALVNDLFGYKTLHTLILIRNVVTIRSPPQLYTSYYLSNIVDNLAFI